MQISKQCKSFPGITDAVVMMATEENKGILNAAGYISDVITNAQPNDCLVIVKGEESATGGAIEDIKANLKKEHKKSNSQQTVKLTTIGEVVRSVSSDEKPGLTLISVPGKYATAEALKALHNDQDVFMFSDNVSVEDEVELKQFAVSKGLLVMGPDCGTGKVQGAPLGFINEVRSGSIGLAGAAGTGLQQVSCLIDQLGEGVTEIIGLGGRDLSAKVGGLTTFLALQKLLDDPDTKTILLVSKPPAPEVAEKVIKFASTASKPIICCFVAAPTTNVSGNGPYVVSNLEDGAIVAAALAKGMSVPQMKEHISKHENMLPASKVPQLKNKKVVPGKIEGLYSGGTFTYEASFLLKSLKAHNPTYKNLNYEVTDLGDDQFTVGVPHPMIDFTTRNKWIVNKSAVSEGTTVLLLDVVLGHGAHENPAEALRPALAEALKNNPDLHIVAHICGTNADPQSLASQQKILSEFGVILAPSNRQAVQIAADLSLALPSLSIPAIDDFYSIPVVAGHENKEIAPKAKGVINLGLKQFEQAISSKGISIYSPEWQPPVEGNRKVGLMLAEMQDSSVGIGKIVQEANQQAVDIILNSEAVWKGVDLAKNVIPFLQQRAIMHAGPPIAWNRMCGPMKGAIVGAILYEGWAKNEAEAWKLAESGEIKYDSCNNHSTVGPMAGIVSPSFPVFMVENENKALGKKFTAFCSMNEGLGKVLRFGAYNDSVLDRLHWIRNVLAPVLQQAIALAPISVSGITAKALQMGDECHNRNAAATALLYKDLSLAIIKLEKVSTATKIEVLDFINNNNHFFLNLSMPACKVILDSAHGITGSTVVTTMARNGVDFGIRVSGAAGAQWFTAPASIIDGLYFPGFSPSDANPDLGDSSITETYGIGASAMAASPAIVGFVGGDASSALYATQEMKGITLASNNKFPIASLDGAGTPLAFDLRRICDTGITPLINTGIAHKDAGVGQIGAGICRSPFSPFKDGLVAVYNSLSSNFNFTKRSYHTSSSSSQRSTFQMQNRRRFLQIGGSSFKPAVHTAKVNFNFLRFK